MSEIKLLDIDIIKTHPDQPRHSDGDVTTLAESIEEIGLVEPLAVAKVTNGDTGYYVVSGHRRLAALKKLGRTQVPCHILVWNLDEEQLHNTVGSLVAANAVREDFTDAERAEVYQTMLDLGMTTETIAKIDGTVPEFVKSATTTFGKVKDEKLIGAHVVPELTLLEAEALAFAADQKVVSGAVETIINAIEQDDVAHTYGWLKAEVEELEKIEATKKTYPEGTVFLEDRPRWDDKSMVPLRELTNDQGHEFTEKNHAGCPGHRVYLRTDYEGVVRAEFYCTNEPEFKHKKNRSVPEHQAKEREEARLGRQFKKDMIAPTKVRREWLAGTLLQQDVTKLKGVWAYLLAAASRRRSTTSSELFWSLLGKKYPSYEQMTTALTRLRGKAVPQAVLASFIAVDEEDCRLCQGPDHFRAATMPEYLTFLKVNGYKLSEHEQKLIPTKESE